MGKSALCKLLSTVLTARLQIPFIATTNVTQTSLLKCLQPFPLCLVKSPTQTYTINAMMRRKGIALRILNAGTRREYWSASRPPGKPPVTFAQKLAGTQSRYWLSETEKFSYPYRGSNPEHSVVQSLVLEWSIWYRKVTHWCAKWVI